MRLSWWLTSPRYTRYMLRELSSFFITVFSLLYIYQLAVLASGDAAAYTRFLEFLKNPVVIGFSVISLGFTLYHSLTWFYLTGKAQPIKLGRRTTTPLQALIVNTAILAIVSYLVITLFLLQG